MTQEKRPLILVCNDDGITAPGIRTLIRAMNALGEVVVVAPDSAQSGMGHAITINSTLRVDKGNHDAGPQTEYSCSGTPVDCVKLAVHVLLDRKPDLLVSGINHGSNSSVNVIYSGTMSAAVEGAMQNIPSIGFSLHEYDWDADFSGCEPFLRSIALDVLQKGMPANTCLNVNFPPTSLAPYKGIRVCRQAHAKWVEEFDIRRDPRGKAYYWLTGEFINEDQGEDTDEWVLKQGFVSVVPVQYDLTAYTTLEEWHNRLEE